MMGAFFGMEWQRGDTLLGHVGAKVGLVLSALVAGGSSLNKNVIVLGLKTLVSF